MPPPKNAPSPGDRGPPRLTHGSLVRPESAPQTAPQPVQPILSDLTVVANRQTHRPRNIDNSRPHLTTLHIDAAQNAIFVRIQQYCLCVRHMVGGVA